MINTIKKMGMILLLALALWGLFSIYQSWQRLKGQEQVTSTILLERIEKVMKLVTVEGAFSEIYDYQHHYFADIWPFRKKALVRVNAKVAVGYDFEKATIDIDEENKIIRLSNLPEPEILSIDHNVDNYDFSNGLFNMISDDDITEMNARAKEFVGEKAKKSDLFEKAEEQKMELLEVLQFATHATGWTLVIEGEELLKG